MGGPRIASASQTGGIAVVAGGPSIGSLTSPVLVGDSFKIFGSGFTTGSVVNFFVSSAAGAVNEGPLTPVIATSSALTVDIPADIPLAQGVVSVQVVNRDQGFAASNLAYALLEGSAVAGIPSLTAINGAGLAATSTDPSFAIDNVETVVRQGSDVILQGSGFDTVNGVAVDVFCACIGGKVGPFFIKPDDPWLTSTSLVLSLPSMGPYAPPVGPASFVISNRGADGSYTKKSNAVSAVIGRKIQVISVRQDGSTLTVDGTGLSTLTVLNFYNVQDGDVVNLGGLLPGGAPSIPITLVSDTELTFRLPAGASPGRSYVQALNPPFIPFSSSGANCGGAFNLVNAGPSPSATPTGGPTATPTPRPTPSGTASPAPTPTFTGFPTPTASSTAAPTATPTTTALLKGVLLAGGEDNTLTPGGSHVTLASAEIYDEASGTFSSTAPMAYARLGASMTALSSGKLLVAGGHNSFSRRPMVSAELFDPQTGSFTLTASMNSARMGHAAVALNNDQVLILGGLNVDFSSISLAELYDPDMGQFVPTVGMADARVGPTATVLKDGDVLIAGGADDYGILSSAELRSPSGDNNIAMSSMSLPRQFATATLLHNGMVLIVGGVTDSATCTGCATATADIYNPKTAAFSPTGAMRKPRVGHTASLLPDGKVLIAGGFDDQSGTVLSSTEIYSPATGTFSAGARMTIGRFAHSASTLSDGKVLIAGGFVTPSTITDTAELYDPATGQFTPTGRMTDSRAGQAAAAFDVSSTAPLHGDPPRKNQRRLTAPLPAD